MRYKFGKGQKAIGFSKDNGREPKKLFGQSFSLKVRQFFCHERCGWCSCTLMFKVENFAQVLSC
jgi:hypothetical protein